MSRVGLLIRLLTPAIILALAACAEDNARRGRLNPSPAPPSASKPGAAQLPALTWAAGYPFLLEPNLGQADSRVKFLSRGLGYNLFLADRQAVFTVPLPVPGERDVSGRVRTGERLRQRDHAVVRIEFAGSASNAQILGAEPQGTVAHHYLGNDPAAWRTQVPTFLRATYRQLYAGIDAVFRAGKGGPAYDFIVAPGAKAESIRLRFTDAERLTIDKNGDLIIRLAGHEFRQRAPSVYQDVDGKRTSIPGGYIQPKRGEIGFQIGKYDRTRPLVIDPTLDFALVAGGSLQEEFGALAVDAAGNVYVTGTTFATDFPATVAANAITRAGPKAFALKLRAGDGSAEYITHIGGLGQYASERGAGIALTSSGEALIAGNTASVDFPATANAVQRTIGGVVRPDGFAHTDAFVARLDAAGRLDFATYIGGSLGDAANAIAVDSTGIYVAGDTRSPDFRRPGLSSPIQTQLRGDLDTFVVKLRLDGSGYIYSTYLGGSASGSGVFEQAKTIAIGAGGEAHVAGWTSSLNDFPTCMPPGPTTCEAGGVTVRARGVANTEGFVAKLNASGSALIYSTLLGGSGGNNNAQEMVTGIALDAAGNAFVAGYTDSSDLDPTPTPQALQPTIGSGQDGFLIKLAPNGAVVFSTYMVKVGDSPNSVVVDDVDGLVWLTTSTGVPGRPYTHPVSLGPGGDLDALAFAVATDGLSAPFWVLVGGSGWDNGDSIAVRQNAGTKEVFVGGSTRSTDIPASTQGPRGGGFDIFVAKFSIASGEVIPQISLTKTVAPSSTIYVGDVVTYTITVENTGTVPVTNVRIADSFSGGNAIRLDQAPGCNPPYPGVMAASIACPASGTVNLAPGESHSFTLTGIASAPGSASNTAQAATAEGAVARVFVASTVQPAPGSELTAFKTVSPSPTIRVGDTVTYTIACENTGDTRLTNVQLVDVFAGAGAIRLDQAPGCSPASLAATNATLFCPPTGTIATLEPGQRRTYTVVGTAIASGTATNALTCTGAGVVPTTLQTTQTVDARENADIGLLLQVGGWLEVNRRLNHFLTIGNNGPDPASSIRVGLEIFGDAEVTLPPECTSPTGSIPQVSDCTIAGPLAAGTKERMTFSVRPRSATVLDVVARTVSSNVEDTVTGNNVARIASVIPEPRPELTIEHTVAPDPIRVGNDVAFTIKVTNSGNVWLDPVGLVDKLEAAKVLDQRRLVQGLRVDCPIVDVTDDPSTIACRMNDLQPAAGTFIPGPDVAIGPGGSGGLAGELGPARTIRLHGHATNCGVVTNTASASAQPIQPNIVSSQLVRTVLPGVNADIDVRPITVSGQPQVYNSSLFITPVRNNGPDPASSIFVTLKVNGFVQIVGTAGVPTGQCSLRPVSSEPQIVDCVIDDLPSGAGTEIRLSLLPVTSTQISLTAEASAACADDAVPGNNLKDLQIFVQ